MKTRHYNGDTKEGTEAFWFEVKNNEFFSRILNCNDLGELLKIKYEVTNIKTDLILQKEHYFTDQELFKKGIELIEEEYYIKTFEERMNELQSLIENIESKIEFLEAQAKSKPFIDYGILLKDLKLYISGTNKNTFNGIMNSHSLIPDSQKAKWIGRPVDAYRFVHYTGLSVQEWNNCFELNSGRKLMHGNKNMSSKSEIDDILKRHFHPK